MKNTLRFLAVLLVAAFLVGCSGSNNSKRKKKRSKDTDETVESIEEETEEETSEQTTTTVAETETEPTETEPEITEPPKGEYGYIAEPDQFSINDEYVITDGEDYQCVYSSLTSHIEGNHQVFLRATAYDAGGNLLDSTGCSIDVIDKDDEVLADFYFYQVAPIDHLEYEFFYNDTDLVSANKDFTIEVGFEEYLVFAATNNGSNTIEFGLGIVLLLDKDGNVIQTHGVGFNDRDNELKVGATEYYTMDIPEGCTDYKLFTTAVRMNKSEPAKENICPELEIVATYTEDTAGATCDYGKGIFYVVKNVSDKKYEFFEQTISRDANTGELLYYTWGYEVINPGETCMFKATIHLSNAFPDTVEETRFTPLETEYNSVLGQLSASAYKDGNEIFISVTNNSNYYVGSPYVYTVTFDANGNYLYVLEGFFGEAYLDPGETGTRSHENQPDVASWELYVVTYGVYEEDPDPDKEYELNDDPEWMDD